MLIIETSVQRLLVIACIDGHLNLCLEVVYAHLCHNDETLLWELLMFWFSYLDHFILSLCDPHDFS